MFRFLPSRRRRRPEDALGAAGHGALPSRYQRPGAGDTGMWHSPGAGGTGMWHSPGAGDTGMWHSPGAGGTGMWHSPGAGHTGMWHSPGAGNTGMWHSPGAGNTGMWHSPGAGDTGMWHSPGAGDTGMWHSPGAGDTGMWHSPGAGDTGMWHSPGAGDTGMWHSPGAGHTVRNAGIPGEAGEGPRRAQVNGKGPGNGGARQEQPKVGNSPRGIQALGKGSGNNPGVPCQAGNGNVPREGTERPRRRAPLPPRAGSREDEEGKPSSNSQSRDKDSSTRNGNVPKEGTDQPVCVPKVCAASREDEEGKPSGNSESRDKDGVTRNGNVPRKGTDRPRRRAPLPPRAGNREDEEGAPSSNSQSRDKDGATRNGNVPKEGADRPRRRAPAPPPVPPRAGRREVEEGAPSSNSQSRDKDGVTRNGNVPKEGTDQPVCVPKVCAASREVEEGAPSSNSQSRDKDSATRNGNVPKEGMDRPRRRAPAPPPVPPRAGRREDEEGAPSSNSQSRGRDTAAAPTPGRDRRTEPLSEAELSAWLWQQLPLLGEDMQNWEGKPAVELAARVGCSHPEGPGDRRTEPPSEAELREWLWQQLPQLGEDMQSWEWKPTVELAARVGCSHPEEPGGTRSTRWERGSGASPDCGSPGGIYRNLLGMLAASRSTETAEEDSGSSSGSGLGSGSSSSSGSGLGSGSSSDWEQSSGASPDHDIPSEIFMLRASGNAESTEEDSGLEQDQDQAATNIEQAIPSRLERKFPGVWARSPLDCGRVAQEENLDGDPVPFQWQRRLRPDEEEQMAKLLQEYLQQGIVEKGASTSNNPLILYHKPHGRGVRLSLDCTALNKATPVEPHESLDRKGFLTSINPRSRFFSVLDLSNACLAIPLAPSCRHRFAFTFQGQQYLFTRLPPTFHGTGSILHRRVAAMLARLDPGAARGVFHYCDDILITGKCRRQLRFRTRRVLQLIQDTGFKVNLDKAQWEQTKVNYLGLTLSTAGCRVPQEKLQQICQDCDAPEPWDAARLRSVLGKFNDLKEFIADYLELALPLQSLAVPEKWEGEREWQWQQEWEREGREQLRRLKEALKAAPTLLFPNKSRPFVIRPSVRECSVGAVLLQEKAGALLPVRHCSHRFSGQSWTPQDASCLAATRAVQAFQKFTGPAPILIRGPAGRYLLRGEPLLDGCTGDSQLPERWRVLVTTKGPERQESQTVPTWLALGLQEPQWLSIPLAPALRQLPADIPKANVWFLAVEKGFSRKPSVAFAAVSLEERWLLEVRQGPVEEEEVVLEVLQELLEQHRSSRPLFLYSGWPRLAPRLKQRERDGRCGQGAVPKVLRWLRSFPGMLQVRQVGTHGNAAPDERRWVQQVTARARAMVESCVSDWKIREPSVLERQEIVAQCHRRCHDNVQGTLCRVRNVEPWSLVQEDVARWVRRCPRCQDENPNPHPDPAPQREEGPWSRLRLSLCPALPESPEGFRALLLVQDELSGWLDAFPLRAPARPEVSQVLLREVFGHFGKVNAVLLEPEPAWLWELLRQPPLRGWHGGLEHMVWAEAVSGVVRVVRALRKGWAAALPLIRAGIAAQWVREEELGALLCVPGLPLEVRCRNWDWDGKGKRNGDGDGKENELSQLRAMETLEGYRKRVQNAFQ